MSDTPSEDAAKIEHQKPGGFLDGILKTAIQNSDVTTALAQPLADFNAAVLATNAAMAAWTKAIHEVEIVLAKYGIPVKPA